jgi:hypothetical protein
MSQVKWSNKNAVKQLLLSIKNYGMPSVLNQNEGGIAIWNENDLKDKKFFGKSNCFQEMIIRDESVEHLCPAKHYDFMYNSIIVPVKPDQIKILSSLSGSVIYDPLKNFLTARCGSIEANVATLALCTDLLLGNHNITDVHNKGIYGAMINKTSDEDFVKGLYFDLCENIKKLNKESKLNKGFWAAAFSVSGDNCLPPDKANKLYGGSSHKPDKPKKGGSSKPDKPKKGGSSKPDKPKKGGSSHKPDKPKKGGSSKPDKPKKGGSSHKPDKPKKGGSSKPDKPKKN